MDRRLSPPPTDLERAMSRAQPALDAEADVAYTTLDTPFGPLLAAATAAGLVRLAFGHETDVLDRLSRRVSPRVLHSPARLDGVRRELDEYFAGRRRVFEMDLDWRLVRGFSRGVLEATWRIPFGAVRTYGEVAAEAGNPRAPRAAGTALHNNPIPVVVPCHRVIGKNGSLTGYGGGLDMKDALLRLEGVRL